jgi:membrane carboxypeptidase/penicillin-binding protein
VHTTLDWDAQRAAERALASEVAALERRMARGGRGRVPAAAPRPQAALVAIDPETGEVRALVGGRDFHESPFDRARQARRQPGSAFKPIVFAAALEHGFGPGSLLRQLDRPLPTPEGDWLPGGDVRTEATLREALRVSSNRAAVHLADRVGLARVLDYAGRLGIDSALPRVPSLALGSGELTLLELTAAYAPFGNGGMRVPPVLITRVENARGDVLHDARTPPVRVLSSSTAFLMTSMLTDVVTRGTASRVRRLGLSAPAAGKTGTTNDFNDAWFVGFTPTLLAGVWVGFDAPRQIMADGYAADVAVPLWARFMKSAAEAAEQAFAEGDEQAERMALCRASGERAGSACLLTRREVRVIYTLGDIRRPIEVEREIEPAGVYTEWVARGRVPPPCSVHGRASS